MVLKRRRLALPLVLVALLAALGGGVWFLLFFRPGPEARGSKSRAGQWEQVRLAPRGPRVGGPLGRIVGSVTDPEGQALEGALVVLMPAPSGDDVSPWAMAEPHGSGRSAGDGSFVFGELGPGRYVIGAMAEGRMPEQVGPIALAAGATETVAIQLAAGGLTLTGRVLDAGGGVVPGAGVRAKAMDPAAAAAPGSVVFEAKTDQGGVYRLTLARGYYLLSARADGYAAASDAIGLVADATRDLRVSPAARIRGRVLERKNRQPVAEAAVSAIRDRLDPGSLTPSVRSDAQGAFEFDPLEPGVYRIKAHRGRLLGLSTAVSVAATEIADGIEVLVDAQMVLAGQVVDGEGKAVAAAEVQLDNSTPPRDRPWVIAVGEDGRFRFEGVWPGSYRLAARAEGRVPAHQELEVTRDAQDLRLVLQAGAVLSGKVEAGDGAPASGAEVKLRVRPLPGGRGPVREQVPFTDLRAETDGEGRFVVGGLPAGQVIVNARHPDKGAAIVDGVSLVSAEKKSVVLRLRPGSSIEGQVRTPDGAPAAGVRVMVTGGTAWGQWMQTVGPDGRYRVSGLSAGPYRVIATRSITLSSSGYHRRDQTTLDLGWDHHLKEVDLEVGGGSRIAGVVSGPNGEPAVGAEITATLEIGGRAWRRVPPSSRALADTDGAFVLEGLGPGPYTVFAENPGLADARMTGVAGGSEKLTLRLAREATVSGTAVTATGEAVAHYTIYLAPARPPGETAIQKLRRRRIGPAAHPADVVHDPGGRFFFGRVGAGAYELEAITADGRRGSLPIEVAEGQERDGLRVVVSEPR